MPDTIPAVARPRGFGAKSYGNGAAELPPGACGHQHLILAAQLNDRQQEETDTMAKKTVTLESWLTTTAHPAIMRAENYRVATDGHSAAGELDRSGQTPIDPAQHEAEFCLKTYREAVSHDPIITLSVAGVELLAKSFSAKQFSVNLQFNGPNSTPRVYVRNLKTGCVIEADVDSTVKLRLNVTVAKSAPTGVNVHLLLRAAHFLGVPSISICRENSEDPLQPLAISWAGSQQEPTRWALVMPVWM